MKNLYLIILFFVSINLSLHAQTFHAIIFADSDDPKIGNSVYQDFENIIGDMTMIANANNMKLKEYHYDMEDCNAENLNKVLKHKLQCRSNDIVFFYYSGHGARAFSDNSKFPQLALGHSDAGLVPLYKINDMIQSKNPKFSLVVADCCNSYWAGATSKDFVGGKAFKMSNSRANAYKNLFGKLKGNIVVSSSKAGETSSAEPDGGTFTICFRREMEKIVSGNGQANWENLLSKTKKATFNRRGHTPVYEINLNETSAPVPQPSTGVQTDNPLIASLIKVADDNLNTTSRINLINPTLNKFFANSYARVEVYGRNRKTLLERETAKDFLERLATSFKLINFVALSVDKNINGKITYLKLQEIYKE